MIGRMELELFSPYRLRGLELRNRLVMAPMTMNQSPGNVINEANIERYEARARGGIGFIITEGALVDHPFAAEAGNAIPALVPKAVPMWRKLVERLHEHDTKVCVQVWHQGPQARPGIGVEEQRERGEVVVRALVAADLEELLASYERAAECIVAAGFDAFEIHAAHGYLLWDILRQGDRVFCEGSRWTGVGFVAEVVRRMRRVVGAEMPLLLRFSQWSVSDYGQRPIQSPEALKELLLPLKEAGVDCFHASTRRFWEPAFEGTDNLAALTKQQTGLPVIMVGSFGLEENQLLGDGPESFKAVETMLKSGAVDLVAVGRPLLETPDWAAKLREKISG